MGELEFIDRMIPPTAAKNLKQPPNLASPAGLPIRISAFGIFPAAQVTLVYPRLKVIFFSA